MMTPSGMGVRVEMLAEKWEEGSFDPIPAGAGKEAVGLVMEFLRELAAGNVEEPREVARELLRAEEKIEAVLTHWEEGMREGRDAGYSEATQCAARDVKRCLQAANDLRMDPENRWELLEPIDEVAATCGVRDDRPKVRAWEKGDGRFFRRRSKPSPLPRPPRPAEVSP